MTATTIDLCIFAHNEAASIGDILADLAGQTVMDRPDIDLRVLVMANGCSDDTAARAEAARAALPVAIAARIEVFDLPEGGKSRTWNRYVHGQARQDADLLMFMDGDIRLVAPGVLRRMVEEIRDREELSVFVSRPVKDIVHHRMKTGLVAKLIAAGGGGLDDSRRAICGQLYVMRGAVARGIWLPLGLPVEDGFLRAMVVSDLRTGPQRLERIDGDPQVFHIYESIRTLGELLHHQRRIVIGGAVNSALLRMMLREAPELEQARALLRRAAEDEGWLSARLNEGLPRRPFGYVPFGFLTKRWRAARQRGGRMGAKAAVTLAVGLVFDAVIYLAASIKMARGGAAGHW